MLGFASDIVAKPVDYSEVDYSVTTVEKQKTSQKVFLISYGDGELYEKSKLSNAKRNKKGFDVFIAYRKEHIDKSFYEQHKNILDQPRFAGYSLWRLDSSLKHSK